MISIHNALTGPRIRLGVVRAEGLHVETYPDDFDARLEALLEKRRAPLSSEEDACRSAARDMLRNGSYKPTGRGKPASEYLLRATEPGQSFPRINAAVDVCNYLSLLSLLPISLWDVNLAETRQFVFRLGKPGEEYVFNSAGQTIQLEDLVVGCRILPGQKEEGEPCVTPIKDSLATKTTPATTRIAASIYAPDSVSTTDLRALCDTFADMLARCGPEARAWATIASPGETVEV